MACGLTVATVVPWISWPVLTVGATPASAVAGTSRAEIASKHVEQSGAREEGAGQIGRASRDPSHGPVIGRTLSVAE